MKRKLLRERGYAVKLRAGGWYFGHFSMPKYGPTVFDKCLHATWLAENIHKEDSDWCATVVPVEIRELPQPRKRAKKGR